MQQLLTHLNNKYGINVCGEGGEYETLTLDCPLFKNFKIVLDEYDIILHSSGTIAPVGVLHPLKFHLESKASELSSLQIPLKPLVSEVRGSIGEDVIEQQDSDACMPMPTSELAGQSVLDLHITSRRLQGSFSTISCWIGTCTSAKGIEDELGLVLASIAGELEKHDLGWGNVLYVHLYIDDMGAFAQANQTYIKHITGDLCIRGVPSRSTVGLSLRNSNLGRVMVEAIATSDMNKKVLHVQSISCWAPSCIGPYSQATLQNGLLYMAGQLGLDPATMVLVSGGAASEMSQALQNCEAVAQAFGTSVKSSSINILIYCSSSISLSEMGEIETVLYKYLGFLGKGDAEAACVNVPVLFVRVPALPKGAMLEVEPFLYLPREDEGLALERASFCSASKTCQWDALSCHSSIAARHICRALFSASLHSKSVLLDKVRISSAIHSVPSSFSLSELQGGFNACLQSLSIMLAKAFLCWEDILALRVLFIEEMVSLCSIVEAWKLALNEFAASHVSLIEGEVQMCSNKDGLCSLEPLFLPVLGIGQNSNITDFISVDLLAVRM